MVQVRQDFEFTLNGRTVSVQDEPPQTTLLDFVRARGLTGAKEGCAEGECGACAVLLVSSAASGATYRSVNSCLMPLPSAAQQEIYTVEALAEPDRLAGVQRAMAEHGGSQCGYCTPGFVVSMFAEQHRAASGERDVHALGGNLCRCTGYRPIQDALRSLPAPNGVWTQRLERAAPRLSSLRYRTHGGEYSRPTSLAETLSIAAQDPAARFVAGNTDLGVLTNLADQRYGHLIALDAVPELREFRETADSIEIGAALSLTEISERWTTAPAAFHEWLELFASILIRNRATLGGNLGTASPIGDSAPFLLSLNAELRLAGPAGERDLPLHSFFTSYRQTALAPGELIRSVRIPRPLPRYLKFYKVAKRRLDDISTVAAGISLSKSGVRIGLGGVAATPLRAFDAEEALTGKDWDARALERAAEALRRALNPLDDHRGSSAYRLAMPQSLLRKFRDEVLA